MAQQAAPVWRYPHPDAAAARRIASRLGLHPVVGQILLNRGLADPEAAREFLSPGRPASLPWRLPGVKAAAWRMLQAVRRQEPVVVYGDYDADGQTSTAILIRALRRLGARVRPFIPHRLSQGYGLHQEVLVEMADRGVRLVVAVDCGLTALEAVREAGRRGLDVVVVDHHEPGPRLPAAAAVVAAHRMGSLPGGEAMAAAGLAYHTARSLLAFAGRLDGEEDEELVQLAAVGTVADVVSLTGENRRLVREGLRGIRTRPLPGLEALARRAGVAPQEIDPFHIAFILAPRLNAAGRVDDPGVGLALLLAATPEEAREPAERLEAANRARQEVERRILEAALREAERQVDAEDPPVLVVAGEGWHPGVIGVVASRLVERFARPAVVVALEGEQARGSARSVPEVNLYEAMAECGPLFDRFGGHPMAAGFSMAARDVPALRERLVQAVAARWRGPFVGRLELDAWVRLSDVTAELVEQLALLEPHGEGNPRPVLAAAELALVEARPVGADGRHLRLVVREPETGAEAGIIAFGRAEEWKALVEQAAAGRHRLDVAFVPGRGRFGEVEIRAVALRPAAGEAPAVEWERPVALTLGPVAGGRPRPAALEGGGVAAAVEDRRGAADRTPDGVWEEWLGMGSGATGPGAPGSAALTVVAVRDPASALRLCTAAWRAASGAAGRVAWAGPDDEPPGAPGLLGDGAGVLVTWAPEVVERLRAPADLWLWQLPLEPWRWARLALGGPVRRLVLAYGQEDRRRLEEGWLAQLPDVEALRHLYRLMTAQASVAGPRLPGDPAELAAALGVLDPRWRPRLSAHLVAHALAIFEELGLVARVGPGHRTGWLWKGAKAGVKLDLTQSARYNELIEARRLWQAALEGAFSEAAAVWWREQAAARCGEPA